MTVPVPGGSAEDLGAARVGGVAVRRYRVRRPFAYTGDAAVDEALSTYEAAVAWPAVLRPGAPVVVGMNGIAAPYETAAFVLDAVTAAGGVGVLVETPLSGSRSLVGDRSRNPARELAPLVERGVAVTPAFLRRLMEGVAGDLVAVDALARRHHPEAGASVLFGISLGCLLASYAFLHEGVGARLLGVIGHPDVVRFAARLKAQAQASLGGLPLDAAASLAGRRMLEPVVRARFGREGVGALHFAGLLAALARGDAAAHAANPLDLARAPERPLRLLIGDRDIVAPPGDAEVCAARLPDAAVQVETGLAHGYVVGGLSYPARVAAFVRGELGAAAW